MHSIRKILARLRSRLTSAPVISASVSASTLTEVVVVSSSADLPANSTSPSSPSPTTTRLESIDKELQHIEALTSIRVIDLPGYIPSPPIPRSFPPKLKHWDTNKDAAANVFQISSQQRIFEFLPSPPTTGLTESDDGIEDDENRVVVIRSPADLPVNIPSPPSFSANEEDEARAGENSEDVSGYGQPNDLDAIHDEILDDIEEDIPELSIWAEPYFAIFFHFLYCVGIVPFNFSGKAEKRFKLPIFHTVGYFCLLLVVVLHSLEFMKKCMFLGEFEGQKLKFIVTFFYAANNLCYPQYFVLIVWRYKTNIAAMISTIRRLTVIYTEVALPNLTFKKAVAVSIISITVAGSFATPILISASFVGFDGEEIIRDQAQELAFSLYVWERGENTSEIATNFDGDMTKETTFMGLAYVILYMLGNTYEALVQDVPMWLALTMCVFTQFLSSLVRTRQIARRYRVQIWRAYQLLRIYSRQIDEIFGTFLQFIHFHHLLYCTYLLYHTIIYEVYGWYSIASVTALAKIGTFYIAAAISPTVNDKLALYIKENHLMDDVLYENEAIGVTATVVLDDLVNDPIGIGRKLLLVNNSFLWKAVGIIGSCFMFLVDSATDLQNLAG